MKKIRAIWGLMRLEHGIMIFIAILIGSLIALEGEAFPPWRNFFLTFLTALFLESSTFALNDYFDYEIDKRNMREDRPLVRGDVKPQTALYLFFIFFPLGIVCSYFVNMICFLIALVTAFLAILYDAKMKRFKLIGNFYIAYVMAIPFVFGGAAVIEENTMAFDIPPSIFIVSLIAFLAGSGREIMKDVMDFEGDQIEGVRSFPKYIGVYYSNVLAAFFYLIAIALSFIPYMSKTFYLYYQNIYYISIIIITNVMLLITSTQLIFNKNIAIRKFRKITLVAVFIGLLGFLIGAFIH